MRQSFLALGNPPRNDCIPHVDLPVAPLADVGDHRQIGMFWMVDTVPGTGRQMVWHNGATGGYSAFVALFPQTRRAVVVMATTGAPEGGTAVCYHHSAGPWALFDRQASASP